MHDAATCHSDKHTHPLNFDHDWAPPPKQSDSSMEVNKAWSDIRFDKHIRYLTSLKDSTDNEHRFLPYWMMRLHYPE